MGSSINELLKEEGILVTELAAIFGAQSNFTFELLSHE